MWEVTRSGLVRTPGAQWKWRTKVRYKEADELRREILQWYYACECLCLAHCDFVKLREMVLRTNMEDLRETTHTKHYEVFRRERLVQMGFADTVDDRPVRYVARCRPWWSHDSHMIPLLLTVSRRLMRRSVRSCLPR